MNADWFSSMLVGWDDTGREFSKAKDLLAEISRQNGGEPVDDGEPALSDSERQTWAVHRAETAISRRLNAYAQQFRRWSERPKFLSRIPAEESHGLSLWQAAWQPVVPINSASAEELEALPAIGKVIAEHIVRRRLENGPLRSLDDLDRISGIGPAALRKLRHAISFENQPTYTIASDTVDAFVERPRLDRFLRLVQGGGLTLLRKARSGSTAEAIVCEELENILSELQTSADLPTSGRNTFSDVRRQQLFERQAITVREATQRSIRTSSAVFDENYLPLARQLIDGAQSSIRLLMFFVRYDERRNTPLNELIDRLCSAHDRGVDVRVILDQDHAESPAMSRLVNRAAYEKLSDRGVPVQRDEKTRGTHSKLLIADGVNVLLGSHNWTLSSFFSYDDTSVYLRSEQLATYYEDRFASIWS